MPLLLLMRRQGQAFRVAAGGLMGAMSLVMMLLSGVLPLATYALPAFAGIVLLPCVVELGVKTTATAFFAVALLSLLLVPDREAAMMYVAFFGYYPIAKGFFERIHSRLVRLAAKLLLFNVMIVAAYQIIIHVLGMVQVMEEIGGWWMAVATLLLGNVGFLIYDHLLHLLLVAYHLKWRKRFFGKSGQL